jgi:hypothetical protein
MARLSKQRAQALLRHCLEHGIVEPHPHFINALKEDGLALIDVMPVLKSGIVYDEPEFSVRFQEWRYKVEGNEVGGKRIAIVFTFVGDEEALLITGFIKKN